MVCDTVINAANFADGSDHPRLAPAGPGQLGGERRFERDLRPSARSFKKASSILGLLQDWLSRVFASREASGGPLVRYPEVGALTQGDRSAYPLIMAMVPTPLAVFAVPLGLTTYQRPPCSFTSWHMIDFDVSPDQ